MLTASVHGEWSHSLQLPTGQDRPDFWRSQISPGLTVQGSGISSEPPIPLWGGLLPFPSPPGPRTARSLCPHVVGLRSCSHSAVVLCSNWACSSASLEIAQVSE